MDWGTLSGILTAFLAIVVIVVGTYDGTNMRLYVDGTLQQTTATTGTLTTTSGDLRTARRYDDSSTTVQQACATALYGTALSGTRVAAHYNAGITP